MIDMALAIPERRRQLAQAVSEKISIRGLRFYYGDKLARARSLDAIL